MKNTENNTKNKIKEFVKKVEDRTNDALEDSLMDEDAKTENFNVDYTDIVKNSAKARISKLPWLIAIFLILVIAIILCLMFFSNNPKTLFTQTVDGLFDYLESNVNENVYDITDGNISLNYTIKSNDENAELYDELSKISYSADYVKDNAGGMSFIDLKTSYNGEDFINANLYGDGASTYVYVPMISENYIKLRDNKLSYFVNGNDVKTVLDGLNQAVDTVIADEKVYGDKENIDVDGKVIKGYRTRLIIDSTNRDRVAENFINTLKANDEFISVLAKMRGVSAADIKSSLDNYLTKLRDELGRHNKFEISLYVDNKTKEFIKVEAVSELGNISLTSEGDNKYSYIISKKSDGTLATGEFAFTVNKNKTKYTYNLYYKKTKDDEVLTESNFDLKYTSKQASSFDKVDVSNSIDLNNMNDIEKIGIYTKIMSDPNLSKFLPIIRKVV